MDYVTDEAHELAQLLDNYKKAGQDPAAWLGATTALVRFATRLHLPRADGREAVRTFEIALVLYARAADFLGANDLPSAAVWQLLYVQALNQRPTAGDAAPYTRAVLEVLGQDR